MRLRRLDLTRYGKFTDHSVDFGLLKPDMPDLHIVYGLNEAGKSTTFAAFLDLLYGIGERSGYNFLHPYNTMRVGGRLAFDGREHELIRLKQRTGSLLDERGQAVPEALLTGALGGIGRDAYRTMFSLDDQSLKDGGNAIIQSKGELGELLFSASSGLAGLSQSLVAAAEEAGSIYKKRSSSTKLAELKRSLETLKAERIAIDTLASTYATLKATYEQAEGAYNHIARELAEAKARHQELTRLLSALPAARELAQLGNLSGQTVPVARPPAEWYALLPQLLRDETRLQALVENVERNIAQLSEALDEIVVDEQALEIAARIDALDAGRVRYLAAEADLPKRQLALAEQEGALSRLLVDLEQPGRAAPEELLLPASLIGIIRDLIEKKSGVDAQRSAVKREVLRARESLERVLEQGNHLLGPADPTPLNLGEIEAVLGQLTSSDLGTRLAVEERTLSQLQRLQDSKFAQLLPWSGDADQLRQMPVPEQRQIESLRVQASNLEKRMADHGQRLRDLQTDQAETTARVGALISSSFVDDAAAHELRAQRNMAWKAHLATLDGQTARTFEERMQQDDALSAERLSRAQELAELRQLRQAQSVIEAGIARQQELLAEARDEADALQVRLSDYLPKVFAVDGGLSDAVAFLESWRDKRAAALGVADDLEKAAQAAEDLRTELDRYRRALAARLDAAGIDEGNHRTIGDLVEVAKQAVARAKAERDARDAHKKALADAHRELAERERDHRETQEKAAEWEREWEQALSRTWFADKGQSVAAVREILTTLATLPSLLKEHQDLAQRVHAMERDQQQFQAEVTQLMEEIGDPPSAGDALSCANALLQRHQRAGRAAQLRADRHADLEKQRAKRRELEEELSVHNAQRNQLLSFFGAGSLLEVEDFLNQAREQEKIDARIAALQGQITETLRAVDFEDASARLAAINAEAVERDVNELLIRIEDLTEQAKLLYSDMSMARQKLEAVGGDDAVARIEAKRRTVLLSIEDLAVRHLTLRTGMLAAEQALHIYREKHRSAMMKRASEAFRLITGNNYSGLTTQPDKDKEILIGISRDGGSKAADAMSTGTQFQLFLALRLAGYEEFAAIRPPVPFIADDIMESFDNPRSEQVFRLLGEMAKVGQVIYLTHHWHLCEIARQVVPSVSIHELPS